MSDTELRALERRWNATPDDLEATQALIGARRRAGLPALGHLVEARRFPARTILLRGRYSVRVVLNDGREVQLAKTRRPTMVSLPGHRSWSLAPLDRGASNIDLLVEEARALACPALVLELGSLVPESVPSKLATLSGLERLRLTGAPWPTDDALAAILEGCRGLVELQLVECNRLTSASTAALVRLEHLVALDLEGTPALSSATLGDLSALRALTRLSLRHLRLTRQSVPPPAQPANALPSRDPSRRCTGEKASASARPRRSSEIARSSWPPPPHGARPDLLDASAADQRA
jgi:hypothetical protein